MAKETVKSAKLKLEFKATVGEDGKEKIKSKILPRLNKDAEIDAVKSVATKLGALLKTPVEKIYKITESEITE